MHIDQALNLSIYAMLLAFFMTILLAFTAKMIGGFKSHDNKNPRDFLAKTKGMAARAHAAHSNSFEILPFFIGSVLCAILFSVPAATVNTIAWTFIALRIAFSVAYIFDKHLIRSIFWTLSAACPVALFILSLV